MIKKTLSTGRKVEIKNMSQDDMDFCMDIAEIRYQDNQVVAIKHSNRARTAWIRKGLGGGDFKTNINGSVPDEVFKEMTLGEQEDLRNVIQECQYLGENKPSPSD